MWADHKLYYQCVPFSRNFTSYRTYFLSLRKLFHLPSIFTNAKQQKHRKRKSKLNSSQNWPERGVSEPCFYTFLNDMYRNTSFSRFISRRVTIEQLDIHKLKFKTKKKKSKAMPRAVVQKDLVEERVVGGTSPGGISEVYPRFLQIPQLTHKNGPARSGYSFLLPRTSVDLWNAEAKRRFKNLSPGAYKSWDTVSVGIRRRNGERDEDGAVSKFHAANCSPFSSLSPPSYKRAARLWRRGGVSVVG